MSEGDKAKFSMSIRSWLRKLRTSIISKSSFMDRKEKFWGNVAEFIKEDFDHGHPSKWKRGITVKFLGHLEEAILERTEDNESLAKICNVTISKGGYRRWNPMHPTTIENLFKYETTKGDDYTKNIFAIYMGYPSFEDYQNPEKRTRKTIRPSDPKQRIIKELEKWKK